MFSCSYIRAQALSLLIGETTLELKKSNQTTVTVKKPGHPQFCRRVENQRSTFNHSSRNELKFSGTWKAGCECINP